MISRLLSLLLLLVLTAGCSNPIGRNESHPHYQTAMKLREQKKYQDAANAFNLCLQQSSSSEKAHLQLAMLYEDHLNDPLLAVYHYQQFLDRNTDETQKKLVSEWLARAELRLRDSLLARHPVGPPPALIPIGPPGASPKSPAIPATAAIPPPAVPPPAQPPATAEPVPASAVQPAAAAVGPSPVTYYEVQAGDNLSVIARKTLGSETQWQRIFDANRDILPSPEKLRIGQKLVIPAAQ